MGCCSSKEEMNSFNINLNYQATTNRINILEHKESQAKIATLKNNITKHNLIKTTRSLENIVVEENKIPINKSVDRTPVTKRQHDFTIPSSFTTTPIRKDRDNSENIRKSNYINYKNRKGNGIESNVSSINFNANAYCSNNKSDIKLPVTSTDGIKYSIYDNPAFNPMGNNISSYRSNRRNRESTNEGNVCSLGVNESNWSRINLEKSNVENISIFDKENKRNYSSQNYNIENSNDLAKNNIFGSKARKQLLKMNGSSQRLSENNITEELNTTNLKKVSETNENYMTVCSNVSIANSNIITKPKNSMNKYKYIFTDQA